MKLPPGQRERSDFPRFGLSQYAERIPTVPEFPSFELVHLDASSTSFGFAELGALERIERTEDFHCVTTWSTRGLRWGGWSLGAVLRSLDPELFASKDADSRSDLVIVASALDGFKGRLTIADALDPSVVLADSLDGKPLGLDHGAPLRLVAPRHYGYKNVKHLKSLGICKLGEERLGYGRLRFLEHLRGRVEFEERGGLPGRLLRYLYRPLVNRTVRKFRTARKTDSQTSSAQ